MDFSAVIYPLLGQLWFLLPLLLLLEQLAPISGQSSGRCGAFALSLSQALFCFV